MDPFFVRHSRLSRTVGSPVYLQQRCLSGRLLASHVSLFNDEFMEVPLSLLDLGPWNLLGLYPRLKFFGYQMRGGQGACVLWLTKLRTPMYSNGPTHLLLTFRLLNTRRLTTCM